jgi:hypothetical protein
MFLTSDPDRLLRSEEREFVDALNAGRLPSVECRIAVMEDPGIVGSFVAMVVSKTTGCGISDVGTWGNAVCLVERFFASQKCGGRI